MGDSDDKGEELGEASEGLGDGRACDAVPELQAPISSRAANAAQRFTKSTISDPTLPRLPGSTGRGPGMGLTCLVKVGRPRCPPNHGVEGSAGKTPVVPRPCATSRRRLIPTWRTPSP